MCCLALVLLGLGPRIGLLTWWIFGDKVDAAFDTFLLPFLGLLFLPWTTIFYVIAWSPVGGVAGGDWLVVGLGVILDVMTYGARAAKGRTQYY